MLEASLSKTKNLLASSNYYPLKMITIFSKEAPEKVRAMFIDLYDESKDVSERMISFKENSIELLKNHDDGHLLQHYQGAFDDLAVESFDEMYDLLAAILDRGIGIQLKQGLYREYINSLEDLSVIRGKINMPGTIQKRISHRNMVTCEFDELSENNIFNRIIKTTVTLLLENPKVKAKYKDSLKKEMLFFSQVGTVDPLSIKWSGIRFQRNNQTYRMLLNICQLIIEGMLLTTEKGEYRLSSFFDEQHMCRLYEKFILEYYIKHYRHSLDVRAAQIPWAADDASASMLPVMQTDIQLRKGNNVLIIDAKYYSRNTQCQFGKHTIFSNNMYQIFTYVKNRDYSFKEARHKVSGMLLYAKTEEEIQPDGIFNLYGSNQVVVKTLDLNQPFGNIAYKLDSIVGEYFDI